MKNPSLSVKTTKDLEEKAVLLQAFFNSVPQYQVLLNKQLEIIAFNDCAFNFNRSYGQLELETGKSILDYINTSLSLDFKIQCDKALRGYPVQYEHFLNGGWFDFVITALYDLDGTISGLSIVGNNINNEKKSERIIRQQSECLSFIAQLQSHQVRHPVASILGLMNLIKEEDDYNLKKEYLQGLETAAKQLDEVIHAIVGKTRQV